jgi:hypothetical protein
MYKQQQRSSKCCVFIARTLQGVNYCCNTARLYWYYDTAKVGVGINYSFTQGGSQQVDAVPDDIVMNSISCQLFMAPHQPLCYASPAVCNPVPSETDIHTRVRACRGLSILQLIPAKTLATQSRPAKYERIKRDTPNSQARFAVEDSVRPIGGNHSPHSMELARMLL